MRPPVRGKLRRKEESYLTSLIFERLLSLVTVTQIKVAGAARLVVLSFDCPQ